MVVLAFNYIGIRVNHPCGFVRNSTENYLIDLDGNFTLYWDYENDE